MAVSLNRLDAVGGPDQMESDRANQLSRGPSIRYVTRDDLTSYREIADFYDSANLWVARDNGETSIGHDEPQIEDEETVRYALDTARYLASLYRELADLHDRADAREARSNGVTSIGHDEPDIVDEETAIENESMLAAETPSAPPNATKYLSKLIPVPANDFEEEWRTCGICQEIYNNGDEPEQACLVGPCGHILGQTCLSRWVMIEGQRPNKTCPLCRAVLFEDDTPSSPTAFDDINEEPFLELVEGLLNGTDGLEDDEAVLPDLLTGHEEPIDEEEFDEPDIEDERYAPAFLDAMSASTQALEEWDRIRHRHHERAEADIAQPPYIFSESILTFFRRFVHRSNVGNAATMSVGSSLRRLMGQLYIRLREDMESTAMPVVWTESGPPLSLLIDPATIPLIEVALERLVDIERQWYEADR